MDESGELSILILRASSWNALESQAGFHPPTLITGRLEMLGPKMVALGRTLVAGSGCGSVIHFRT